MHNAQERILRTEHKFKLRSKVLSLFLSIQLKQKAPLSTSQTRPIKTDFDPYPLPSARKGTMNVITKSLLLALWGTKAFGFTSPHHRMFFQRKLAPSGQPKILRSTAQPVGEKLDGSYESEDASKRTDEGIEALKKLLARQQEELRVTESLLESLQNSDGLNHIGGTPASLATSIASGFNYGFVSRSEGANFTDIKGGAGVPAYGPPANIWRLGLQQFWRNWDAMKGEYRDEDPVGLTPKQEEVRAQLERLTLNSTAIWEKENALGIEGPWVIKAPYYILCWFLDVLFEGRYAPSRFFLLETVARMPYFSYITMLHLYETLGFWRRSVDMKRIHFAEEMNEFRHLMIMESLGGDQQWGVRFIAQHSAIVYYIVLCLLWGLSPSLSYKFSEMLESHAVNTYGQFLEDNPEILKKLPPPTVAVEYYALGASDPFYAEIQTSSVSKGSTVRRPGENMNSLYDVFCAIKADEADHVSTMTECLDPTVAVRSPSIEKRILTGLALAAAASVIVSATGTFVPTDVAVDGTAVESLASGSAGLFEAISAGAAALTAQIMAGASQGVVSETAYSAADVLVANSVVDSVDGVLDSVEAAGASEGGTMLDMIMVGLAAATKEAATTEGEAKILGSDIDIVLELFGRAIMDAIYTVARFLAVLLMAL